MRARLVMCIRKVLSLKGCRKYVDFILLSCYRYSATRKIHSSLKENPAVSASYDKQTHYEIAKTHHSRATEYFESESVEPVLCGIYAAIINYYYVLSYALIDFNTVSRINEYCSETRFGWVVRLCVTQKLTPLCSNCVYSPTIRP